MGRFLFRWHDYQRFPYVLGSKVESFLCVELSFMISSFLFNCWVNVDDFDALTGVHNNYPISNVCACNICLNVGGYAAATLCNLIDLF